MKKIFISAVCGALCAATAASVSATAVAEQSGAGALDFSRLGYGYSELSAAQFIESAGIDISQNERDYLNANSDFSLKYSDKIADGYINVEEINGNLYVSAEPYSYVAANGTNVIWSPVAFDGEPIPESGHRIIDLDKAADFVTVTYDTELTIGKDYVNKVLNEYYNAVEDTYRKLQAKQNEYYDAVAQYEEDLKDYTQYLSALEQYEKDVAEYNDYLVRYAEWKRKSDDYLKYLDEYSKYLEEVEAYANYEKALDEYFKNYQRYEDYKTALKSYEEQYKKYLESIEKPEVAAVKGQISILSYMYAVAGEKRTIRGAIMGNAVTQVLENKDGLQAFGADKKAINEAETATRNLRNLITNYDKLKNGEEEDKYLFYITAYESLRDNFNELLRSLDYFYRIDNIYNRIIKEGKEKQYSILLAQLYEICDALNTEPLGNYEEEHKSNSADAAFFTDDYTIRGSKPSDILGGVTLDFSGDPTPLETGYPEMPQEPVEPEKVDAPVRPQKPNDPKAPDEVADPGAEPFKVDCPESPKEVAEPVYPTAYIPTDSEKTLDGEHGNVLYRTPFEEDYVLNLSSSVNKYFRNWTEQKIRFYLHENDDEFVYEGISINGSYVEYPSDKPMPEMELVGHTCTFVGWKDYNGNAVDLSDLPNLAVINVYPRFEITPNEYDVFWVIGDTEIKEKATYGELPLEPKNPKKPNDGLREFRFIGWDKEILPTTTEPARYVAQFESSILITWQNYDRSIIAVNSVWQGEIPQFDGVPRRPADSRYVYKFKGWDKDISPATEDAVYTAAFSSEYILPYGMTGALVSFQDGNYVAECKGQQQALKVDVILGLAEENDAGVVLRCSNFVITFSANETYNYAHSGVAKIDISSLQTGYAGYIYNVILTDDGGGTVNFSGTFGITINGVFDTRNSRLYRTDAQGNTADVRISLLTEQSIAFSMRGDCSYEVRTLYSVKALQSEEISFFVDAALKKYGEKVTVTLGDIPDGRFVEKLYVVDADYNDIEVDANLSFIMPKSDVVVGVVLGYIEYKIEFRVDGKTLSTKTYRYGETVVPPSNPVKAPDGDRSYSFIGWDSEIQTVTQDMVYNAVFNSEPLPVIGGGLTKLMKILIGVSVGVGVFIIVFTTVVVLIVRKKKKKG